MDLGNLLSLGVALLALLVSLWQALRSAKLADHANQIQVIAEAFQQVRSPQFLAHYKVVLTCPQDQSVEGGFESLDEQLRESAYAVSYFFEHLGVLVVNNLIPSDVLLSTMCTLISRSWMALENAIRAEKALRELTYQNDVGVDFLPHFKALKELARERSATSSTRNQRRSPIVRIRLPNLGTAEVSSSSGGEG